jgi:hypothetical protein
VEGEFSMDEEAFRKFLKRGGRKSHTVNTIAKIVRSYEVYLQKFAEGKSVDQATPDDLEKYVEWFEFKEEISAKRQLWGIRYYYRFIGNRVMNQRASELREERTAKTRKSFRLRDFRGVNRSHVEKLEALGIRDVEKMLEKGHTRAQRDALAKQTGVPKESILELVKLSDLARLPGVKAIRARLYFDAGIDTLEKMAQWDPEELRLMLIDYVEKTGFDGIAPLPKEAANSVKTARNLPKRVEF